MKKALSILLIIAALFGFYGGAVNLTDILECKDYWEEEGRKTTEDLNTLEDGLDQLHENTDAYLDGVDQLAAGEAAYAAAPAQIAKGKRDLAKLQTLIDGVKMFNDTVESSGDLAGGYQELLAGRKTNHSKKGQSKLKEVRDSLISYSEQAATPTDAYKLEVAAGMVQSYLDFINNQDKTSDTSKQALSRFCEETGKLTTPLGALDNCLATTSETSKDLGNKVNSFCTDPQTSAGVMATYPEMVAGIENLIDKFVTKEADKKKLLGCLSLMKKADTSVADFADAKTAIVGTLLYAIPEGISNKRTEVEGSIDSANKAGGALSQMSDALFKTTSWQTMMGGVQMITDGALGSGSADVINALNKAGSKSGLSSKDIKSMAVDYTKDMENNGLFKAYMAGDPTMFAKAASAMKKFAGGLNTVKKNGQKQLREGIASYKAAPAQLAEGRAQLAQYEDGEAQIRDGLASLMAAEANGGLTSIADRIGADEDFNLADGNLDFDAAYNGVDQGRAYSDDSGVVITKEIATRAVGTGLGLAGALMALIAAILCFVKKYKGAGIFAALTAACGVIGIIVAKSAGTEFSGLAGSPLSPIPYVAFGILAALGVVCAVADFGAKKEA